MYQWRSQAGAHCGTCPELLQFLLVECMGIVAIPVCLQCNFVVCQKCIRAIGKVYCHIIHIVTVTHPVSLCRYSYTLPHIHGQAMNGKGNSPEDQQF